MEICPKIGALRVLFSTYFRVKSGAAYLMRDSRDSRGAVRCLRGLFGEAGSPAWAASAAGSNRSFSSHQRGRRGSYSEPGCRDINYCFL